jgi:hypothetical protein
MLYLPHETPFGSHQLHSTLRRLACLLCGHKRLNTSIATVGIVLCGRCLRIVDYRTVRRLTTRGDMERLTAKNPPEGYSFASCNWGKHKAKFVSPTGKLKFVAF